MLSRARVQGYKCLRDVTVELGRFNVLIGRNDSGKSAFLQAMAEPSLALLRWHPTSPAEVSRGDWTIALEGETGVFLFDSAQYNKPRYQHPAGPEDTLNFLSRRQAEIWFASHHELATTDPVSLDPGHIALHSPAKDAAIDAFVTSRGGGTAAHLAALALGDRERFDAVEGALQEVTGGRVHRLVVKDVGGSTYTLAFKLHDGTVVAAQHMSQGLLLYTGFLALVHRATLPGVLLVEEPERGLHPQRLVEVISALRGLSERGVQVLVTTHSPDVLGVCKASEILIFHRRQPQSPTEVQRLPEDVQGASEPLGHVWSARGDEGLLELARRGRLLAAPAEADAAR
jgi:predicted ATPase